MHASRATPAKGEGRDFATRATLAPERALIGRVTTLNALRHEPAATMIERALALDPQRRALAVGGIRGPIIDEVSVAVVGTGWRTWSYALHGSGSNISETQAARAPPDGPVEAIALCFASAHTEHTVTLRSDFAMLPDAEASMGTTPIWFVPGALDAPALAALMHRAYIDTYRRHCDEGAINLVEDEHQHLAHVRAARMVAANATDAEREALRLTAQKFLVPQAQAPGARYRITIDGTSAKVRVEEPGAPTR